jgi:flagellar biosynthesis protein FlhA
VSVPDPQALRKRFERSSLGGLVYDPLMSTFVDGLRQQGRTSADPLRGTLEITLEELEKIGGGEIALGVIEQADGTLATVTLVDTSGREDQVKPIADAVCERVAAKGGKPLAAAQSIRAFAVPVADAGAAAAQSAAAYRTSQARAKAAEAASVESTVPATEHQESAEASWDDVTQVDVLGLEVGYRLIPLVDRNQDGELLRRIKGIRKKFAQEIGFLAPAIHIRDNLELRPSAYRIVLKGVEVGRGESFSGQFLAIDPGRVSGTLPGAVTRDPAFGLPAVWIESGLRDRAVSLGYTVVDAGTVVATHLNHVISQHASELLGRQEVQQLLDHLAKQFPKLVDELIPKLIGLPVLQKVLQNLLAEGVHIRDMRTIVDTLTEHAVRTQNPSELTELVRGSLGRAIVQQIFPGTADVQVIALDQHLQQLLSQAVGNTPDSASIEPGLADTVLREAAAAAARQEAQGVAPVLLVPASLRAMLSRFLRRTIPNLSVLAHNEIPEQRTLKVTAIIGGKA